LVGANELADGAEATFVGTAGTGFTGGGGATGFVDATTLVAGAGTTFVGVTGEEFAGGRGEGSDAGGQLVCTFVPMMTSGGPVGGLMTGAGGGSSGGVLTGAGGAGGAGGCGNSGMFTMPGGKFIVQPAS
jgi:hypothetical protein